MPSPCLCPSRKSQQSISDQLHIPDPQSQVSSELCQANWPYHLLSLYSNFFSKLYLLFSSFCPWYSPIFFSLIRWSCLLPHRESRCYQTENSHSQRLKPSCRGINPILLHSYKSRGVDITISPLDLWIPLPPTTFRLFNYYLPFYFQHSQPFSKWSFSVFKHLPTISTRTHFQPLPYPSSPIQSNFKEELFSPTVAISSPPTYTTTHSNLHLMPSFY